jgi:cytoskeletal protein RodZ
LFIALGALMVLVVLVAAGLYIPRSRKASAADEPKTTVQQQAPSAPQTPAQPPAAVPAPAETKPAEVAPPVEDAKAAAAKKQKLMAKNAQAAADVQAAAAAAAAAKARAEALDRVEHEIDQLTGRAAGVNASLDRLQHQQAADGFGLRGDMASHQGSMKVNLAKAQDAISRNDLERAQRYAAMAAADVEALEKFLGR